MERPMFVPFDDELPKEGGEPGNWWNYQGVLQATAQQIGRDAKFHVWWRMKDGKVELFHREV